MRAYREISDPTPAWDAIVAKVLKGDILTSKRDAHVGRTDDPRGVKLLSVPASWSDLSECRVEKAGDVLVGISLDACECDSHTFSVSLGGIDAGRVLVRPKKISYALRGLHCLPMSLWAPTIVRECNGARPCIHLIYALFRDDYRRAMYLPLYVALVMEFPSDHLVFRGYMMSMIRPGRRIEHPVRVVPPLMELERRLAVDMIARAYLGWRWRKDVLWNPHSDLGSRRLTLEAERFCVHRVDE